MLKINYDRVGKANSVLIKTFNSYYPVPINLFDLSIDWDSITYPPTRQAIRTAWETWAEGKDLADELRDRPDLEPAPLPREADWDGLGVAVLAGVLTPLYNKITLASFGTGEDNSIVKLRNVNNIAVAAGKIDQAARVEKLEPALAASLWLLFSTSDFKLSQEEKDLWNKTTQTLGFSEVIRL